MVWTVPSDCLQATSCKRHTAVLLQFRALCMKTYSKKCKSTWSVAQCTSLTVTILTLVSQATPSLQGVVTYTKLLRPRSEWNQEINLIVKSKLVKRTIKQSSAIFTHFDPLSQTFQQAPYKAMKRGMTSYQCHDEDQLSPSSQLISHLHALYPEMG